MQTQAVIRHIADWLKNYAAAAHAKGFVVGVSGGIDFFLLVILFPCVRHFLLVVAGYPARIRPPDRYG